ncbi:MAG: amino acid permease [Pseudomonadota bacterium]
MTEPQTSQQSQPKRLGFWSCWSLTVGIMIGSGVFLLPAVLAPYGLLSFAGWILTGGGSILLALVFARLSSRTNRSGGVFVYAQEAFGDLTGFLIAWGYWTAYWIAIPAAAIAFVGYLVVLIPDLTQNTVAQTLIALGLIWLSTLINIRGVREATLVQLLMTVLKLIPLFLVIALGLFVGDSQNLPEFNPKNISLVEGLAVTALLTMWAFSGMEAGAMPAGDVRDPERTIPRAIIFGTLTVAFVYIAATAAVMLLVPQEVLVSSTSPFAEAAIVLGDWGPKLIAVGALVSTAGALHGTIFMTGQIPMAVALDKLAPAAFAKRNQGGAPYVSLILASVLGSILLIANYSRGLIGAFMFLIMMSTLTFMIPLLASSIAELRYSWRSARGWAGVAAGAAVYSVFAILGSGFEVIMWGIVLLIIGVPIYYLVNQRGETATDETGSGAD